MPYQQGDRLPGERASRLGHLDVLKSELVNKLCNSFESPEYDDSIGQVAWIPIPSAGELLPLIFGVDGSLQIIEGELAPHKALAFVKTALLRLDTYALAQIDKETPHPFKLRDILSDSALYHSTVFPLRHVSVPGMSVLDTVREVIYDSVCDASLSREPIETLKWLMYEKWDGVGRDTPAFQCPHADHDTFMSNNTEVTNCNVCSKKIFLTDALGFHQEMSEDSAPNVIASNYMLVHETLLLFTAIRYFWENKRELLSSCLFLKDGPLSIRAQYSKLVAPIRRFLTVAKNAGVNIHIAGQEKTGYFVEHLDLISRGCPSGHLFVPDDAYIKEQVQHRSSSGAPYGRDTNYGNKVFIREDEYHKMVLSIPTGEFNPNAGIDDLIGASRIFATIKTILSNRHEGALIPIELAHGVASLSTYPSAHILKIFAETKIH